MKIIIVGIGKLGEYLAKHLVRDNNEVTLVDIDFSNRQNIINNEDVNYINGNGLDSSVLEEAGIRDADILISVMEKDEQNVMCTLLGKKLGAKRTIARIRTPEYANSINILKEDLGLSMSINPELMTAAHIARILSIPSALDVTTFFKGRIEMISFIIKEKSKLEGMTIHSLSKKMNNSIIVCAIKRNDETIIPRGNTKIQIGDKLHVTGLPKDINNLLKYAKLISNKTESVMISGGSNTAIYLSKILLDVGINVKLIDISPERCKFLSEVLPEALIINGDVSNQNLLYEEGIESCDAFISLNSIDEENIVYSMFASLLNVPKIITKINHINLDGVVEQSKINTVITPHKIASNQIISYIKAMKNSGESSSESIYKFDDENFELLEFKIKNDFEYVNCKIKELKLKEEILIVAIMRGKNIIFPTGNDELKYLDTVIIVNHNKNVKDINDILV